MLRFLQRNRPPLVRSAPEGCRLYAVGDVHGRLDALDALIAALWDDMAQDDLYPVLILLGDYVDRGPASRAVLDRLLELEREAGLEAAFIRGNHDDAMMRFAGDPSAGPGWCGFGGGETLRHYGVAAPLPGDDPEAWSVAQEAFAAALPPDHLRFLRSLQPYVQYGDYFFTHAGARPGVELEDQDPHDLMWIRDEFLRSSTIFSKTVVHGHTAEQDAFVSDRRIGVDTGAYATGKLTAVVLEGRDRRLIQAQVSAGRTTVEHVRIVRQPERRRA